jgi:hypothetical protein
MAESGDDMRLTRKEIGRLVHNWIGVDNGYLGSFSYAKHDRFWMEACAARGHIRLCWNDSSRFTFRRRSAPG